ncbi:MAG TPA: pesticidal protein Cry15Aa [Anaerolineae bacterium]|nr:pesticidal protein Cry15Aa [Anaerolineae bacterium]
MPLIKRYPNRKLYDTEARRYVTLEGIARLIQAGEDVQVVDHQTGEDLTTLVLSQVILEQERRKAGSLPQSLLTSLIRIRGGPLDYLVRSLRASANALRLLESEFERRLEMRVACGELAEEEASQLREEVAFHATSSLQHHIEAALRRLNLPTRTDIQKLEEQIEALDRKVEAFLRAHEDE